ncbi:MAG: ABC transporter ATP-binding protein [Janthinobacterium lividum]
MSEAITVRGLTKHYALGGGLLRRARPLQALAGVSLSVRSGTTFGVVGESGSGKTTLAKLLMGAEVPTGGTIAIEGRPMRADQSTDLAWLRTVLQPVLQDPDNALNPRLRIRDIVEEPLLLQRGDLSREARQQRVLEILEQVGLSAAHAERHPAEMSGGQKQRVAIARALSLSPRIVILDEPVSALDVSVQAQVLNLLHDMQRAAALTYVLISHDLAVVAHMSTDVAVMYLGKIQELGPTDAVLARPRHFYTQALIQASQPLRGAAIEVLHGEIPSPLEPPSGCRFHPRCVHAVPRCRVDEPALRQIEPAHWVACHLA